MPDQIEELKLQVTLVDNASTGLASLKKQLDELSKSGTQDKFKNQISDTEKLMKVTGLAATGAAKAIEELAGKYGWLAAKSVAFGYAGYRMEQNLRQMTTAMNDTRLSADRLGVTFASLKNIGEQMSMAGYKAAEHIRLVAQVNEAAFQARRHRTTEMFDNLIAMTARPDIILSLQRELAGAKEDADRINVVLKYHQVIEDEIRKNNKGANEDILRQNIARAKEHLDQGLGITVDLSHAKMMSNVDKDRAKELEEQAKNIAALNASWNATLVNLERIKDTLIAPLMRPGSPFRTFAEQGEKNTGKMADDLERWRGGLKGSFWDFFKLPPELDWVRKLLTGGTLSKGRGGGLGQLGGRGAHTMPGTHEAPSEDMSKSIGIDAPILQKKKKGWSPWDLFGGGSDPVRFTGGGTYSGGQSGFLRGARMSTNIEDRRSEGEEYMKRREENTKLLVQVNDKLFALLQPGGGSQSGPSFSGLGGLPGLGGRAGPGYTSSSGPRSSAPYTGPSVSPLPPSLKFPTSPDQGPESIKAAIAGGFMRPAEAGASGGKKTGWWTPEHQAHAVDYLMKNAGLTEIGARGLVSRWANVEAAGGPSEVNPKGGALGIAQWLGSRQRGVVRGDFEGQLKHAAEELNTSEKAAGDALRQAKTPDDAARGASMYERAEGYSWRTGRDLFTGKTAAGIPNIAGVDPNSRVSGIAGHMTIDDISKLKGDTATATVPSTGGASLISPIPGVSNFGIGSGNVFGASRSGGGRPHSGNDLHGPTGSPAVSMNDGTVLYNGRNSGYNANIVIKGDDGIIRRYAVHGATENLPPGTRVSQGQRIGTIGQGHIHYEEIPPTIGGKPNPVYQEFIRNARSNTFTSTSYQRGVVDPSGPNGTLSQIGKAAPVAPSAAAPTAEPSRGLAVAAQGIQARYKGMDPKVVEQNMREIAQAEGFKDIINISGGGTYEEERAAVLAALKRGDVTGAIGFSRGANILEKMLNDPDIDPKVKDRIKEVVLIGRTQKFTTGRVPGIKTIDIPEIAGVSHMQMTGEVAKRAKAARETIDREAAADGQSKPRVSGKLTVDVEGEGAVVHARGTGAFSKTEINRRHAREERVQREHQEASAAGI